MSLFRTNIKSAIQNQALQAALDKNYAQRIVARESAYADLDEDIETIRQKTRTIRTTVIDSLNFYLEQFIQQAQKNGFIIHQADNAQDAREIVLQLAKKQNVKLVAKSKSMMSEEIHLNPALEQAGIEVIETDLGEYIVQLRKEPPSHIITPAVHLRREEVAETFQKELGIPYTTDIQILTNTARARLRQIFLTADMGISGVNIGVSDSGTICIVTNEGNGRMVTTLPKVHIALMGIERLVPDLESLAHILKVLPRSATGQKISVYTQLIHGPRNPDEIDGAPERHIVLIDNGRSKLLNSPLAEVLRCIRCGACINACPVFREIGGFSYTSISGSYTPYPGPIGSVLSPGIFGQRDFGHLAQASSLCGACKEACPVDIDLPTLLLKVRSGGINLKAAQGKTRVPEGVSWILAWGLRLFTWISTKPNLYKLAQRFLGWTGRVWSPRKSWLVLPGLTGWGFSKDFPRPAVRTFSDRWKNHSNLPSKFTGSIPETKKEVTSTSDVKRKTLTQKTGSLITRFKDELTALGGVFIEVKLEELGSHIHALLQEKEIKAILAWDSPKLPDGLLDQLKNYGISVENSTNPNIQAGLTGITAAVADTGTLILKSGSGQPASTSLLPEIHIAVMHQKDLYENLPQAFRLREITDASSCVLISGPSRTADIEMTLTIGVHGPKEVHVYCLTDT
jgi:L-lactate dehydrogenase complex protein LldF